MPSPFGGVTDVFSLTCEAAQPATASVTIDMYHETVETRAVPGFTISP